MGPWPTGWCAHEERWGRRHTEGRPHEDAVGGASAGQERGLRDTSPAGAWPSTSGLGDAVHAAGLRGLGGQSRDTKGDQVRLTYL